jgi:HSP20 family protein
MLLLSKGSKYESEVCLDHTCPLDRLLLGPLRHTQSQRVWKPAQFLLVCTISSMEDSMSEKIVETKAIKPIPVPYEELEEFPRHMQEFFDLIARRPFELLEKVPRLFERELETWFKPEAELIRPIHLRMYENDEALFVRAEVPGFTEKELDINVEPWRLTITGKRESKEVKKEGMPAYKEVSQIYRSVKLPVQILPENVKATLKNGILEFTMPKTEVVKKIKVEVKPS